MKKGFTLLELMVVIVIIGVLATLGLTQYSRVIEKSRAAEAKSILGALRSTAATRYMENNSDCTTCTTANLITNVYPAACGPSHYFSYSITASSATGFTALATRCTASGKAPNSSTADTVQLASNFNSGVDTWTTTGPY